MNKSTYCWLLAVDLVNGPVFYEGTLNVTQPSDTFMSLRGWNKGVAFINGFNLGRFWPVLFIYVWISKIIIKIHYFLDSSTIVFVLFNWVSIKNGLFALFSTNYEKFLQGFRTICSSRIHLILVLLNCRVWARSVHYTFPARYFNQGKINWYGIFQHN